MEILVKILVLLIIAQISLGIKNHDYAYEIQMDHLQVNNLPNGNSFDFKTWRITKFNRTTYVMKGQVLQLTNDLTKVEIELIINLLQGNVYKYTPFGVKRKPFCDFWKNDYKNLLYSPELHHQNISNIPEPEECPPSKREFWIKDYIFDKTTAHLPPHMEGRFRIDINLYENNAGSGGFMFYFSADRLLN